MTIRGGTEHSQDAWIPPTTHSTCARADRLKDDVLALRIDVDSERRRSGEALCRAQGKWNLHRLFQTEDHKELSSS